MAWMLLSNANVLSLEDGILTLRFPRDGEMKGFSVSGHDAVLKRVLSARFGLTVTVKGVTGGDAASGAAGLQPGRPGPGSGSGRPPAPARPGPAAGDSGAGIRPAGFRWPARRAAGRHAA